MRAERRLRADQQDTGVLMGGISIARIEFSTWVKYIWKVLLAMLLVHVVILSVAMVVF